VNIRADLKGAACRRKTAARGRLFYFGGAEGLLLAGSLDHDFDTADFFTVLRGVVARHQAWVAKSLTQPVVSRVAPRMKLELSWDMLIDSPVDEDGSAGVCCHALLDR
jgi:hypothetical protein